MRLRFLIRAMTLAAAAVGLLGTACTGASGDDAPETPAASTAPVAVAVRTVCSLVAQNPDAAAVGISGADGTQSAVAGGRAYWFFGDTVRDGPGGRKDVIHASVATSNDNDATDCVDLSFKQTNGEAQPLFPKLSETTVWPDGVLTLDDGSIVFYMVKAVRESPFSWHVSGVGLGRIAAGQTTGVRVTETLWDDQSGFGSRIAGVRSPVRIGDDVIVYIRTDAGGIFAAKAPVGRLDNVQAYVYRAGDDWVSAPSEATPLWPVERGVFPADNGVQVTYDEESSQWMALYNGELATVRVRTAPEPWGPWSAPVTWFDCKPLVGDRYPYCYSSEMHTHLTRDGGLTRYVTLSSQEPYDVTLVEVTLGVAIRTWADAGGRLRYAAAAGAGYDEDRGVAFYASAIPAGGMSPVYERMTDSGPVYTLYRADVGEAAVPAFYAYAVEPAAVITAQPVYRWQRDGVEVLDTADRPGFERGDVAFWAVD